MIWTLKHVQNRLMDEKRSTIIFHLFLNVFFLIRKILYGFLEEQFIGNPVADITLRHQNTVVFRSAGRYKGHDFRAHQLTIENFGDRHIVGVGILRAGNQSVQKKQVKENFHIRSC